MIMLILEFAGAVAVIWIGAMALVVLWAFVVTLMEMAAGSIRRTWRYFRYGELT